RSIAPVQTEPIRRIRPAIFLIHCTTSMPISSFSIALPPEMSSGSIFPRTRRNVLCAVIRNPQFVTHDVWPEVVMTSPEQIGGDPGFCWLDLSAARLYTGTGQAS